MSERKRGVRPLGTVQEWGKAGFAIEAARGSALSGVERGPYADLDEAMQAISHRLGGTCELWSAVRQRLVA